MAKATTWIKFKGERVELWFGVAAAKKFQALTGESIMDFDETMIRRLGFGVFGKMILAGFAHLSADKQPTEADVDAMIDALESEIEPAEPTDWFTAEEAAADVLERRAVGQEPKIEELNAPAPGTLDLVHVWRVVDVPTQPEETFTTMWTRVSAAFGEGLPGTKKKRKQVAARPTKG